VTQPVSDTVILFFSEEDQNQFLLELKVIEDKGQYISFSALFLTQVANLFWLPAVLYTAECKFKMSSTTYVPSMKILLANFERVVLKN
jgi:hypothetical protein